MRVVVQVSGGIESTTMLAQAIKEFLWENVYAISFDDDSVFYHNRDRTSVKRVITKYQMQDRHFLCRVPQSDFLEYNEDAEYKDVGFIPGYKMFLNTASMAYAQRVGASQVWIGNMSDNVYGDESMANVRAMEQVYNDTYANGGLSLHAVKLVTPFMGMSKADVIRKAVDLKVDLADTLSCGDEKLAGGHHCGKCVWCSYRKAGFKAAGIDDPTIYAF